MIRNLSDARRWTREATVEFIALTTSLTSSEYASSTLLPGWSRRHLVAHVAANADALGNLVRWAATGEPTPMYATPEERTAGIERGSTLTPRQLNDWLRAAADQLQEATDALTELQWSHQVVTAQGRTVAAAEIPWLRAREVWVHAVDLDTGFGFTDLPEDFLLALEADVIDRRGVVPEVGGTLGERVAWLTGRPHALIGAPQLDPWL